MSFNPNESNYGGRACIYNLVSNHKKAVENSKPILKTQFSHRKTYDFKEKLRINLLNIIEQYREVGLAKEKLRSL
jgi:hypothetical protein